MPQCQRAIDWLMGRGPCLADDTYFLGGGPVTIPTMNYRLPEIPFDWPLGEAKYWREDWSSDQQTQVSVTASFQVLRAEVVSGPTH